MAVDAQKEKSYDYPKAEVSGSSSLVSVDGSLMISAFLFGQGKTAFPDPFAILEIIVILILNKIIRYDSGGFL